MAQYKLPIPGSPIVKCSCRVDLVFMTAVPCENSILSLLFYIPNSPRNEPNRGEIGLHMDVNNSSPALLLAITGKEWQGGGNGRKYMLKGLQEGFP